MSVYLIAESIIPIGCVTIVLITLPIYTTTVIILIQGNLQPEGNNSFYRLCTVGGIVDILAILDNYLMGILPARGLFLPFYLSSTKIGATYLAISWGLRYSQNITALLMEINRLTAMVTPTRFRKIWSDQICLAAHGVQILPGIFFGGILYSTDFYYEDSGLGGIYTMFGDENFKKTYYNVCGTIGSFFIISMISIYIVVWVLFRKLRKVLNSVKKQEMQRQENRLLYISLCICSMEIICFIFTIVTFLIKFDPSGLVAIKPVRFFYLFYNANVDIYSSASPYLLITFSTPFKKRFLQVTRILQLQIKPRIRSISSNTPSSRLSIVK